MKVVILAASLLTAVHQPAPAPAPAPGSHAACNEAVRSHLDDLIRATRIDHDGDAVLVQELRDRRYLEPYSGAYFQISAAGREPLLSRSLWDRSLKIHEGGVVAADRLYESREFSPERLRVGERIVRPASSATPWRFQVGLAC